MVFFYNQNRENRLFMERAENIGSDNDHNPCLPNELIIENILPRLPVKTIFRF
ncbi:hypothetical protein FRX31_004737, partial [Thalictrum thalictroides]